MKNKANVEEKEKDDKDKKEGKLHMFKYDKNRIQI